MVHGWNQRVNMWLCHCKHKNGIYGPNIFYSSRTVCHIRRKFYEDVSSEVTPGQNIPCVLLGRPFEVSLTSATAAVISKLSLENKAGRGCGNDNWGRLEVVRDSASVEKRLNRSYRWRSNRSSCPQVDLLPSASSRPWRKINLRIFYC